MQKDRDDLLVDTRDEHWPIDYWKMPKENQLFVMFLFGLIVGRNSSSSIDDENEGLGGWLMVDEIKKVCSERNKKCLV